MRNLARAAFSALGFAILVTACDNPVDDGDEHVRPSIITISSSTVEFVRGPFTGVTGTLTVRMGQESGPLTVRFFDAQGQPINPSSEYHLEVTGGAGIAQWVKAGEFVGRLRGVAAGTTTLRFSYVHGVGASAHAEVSFNVPVIVTVGEPE